jgi:hypothetical protein
MVAGVDKRFGGGESGACDETQATQPITTALQVRTHMHNLLVDRYLFGFDSEAMTKPKTPVPDRTQEPKRALKRQLRTP